MTRDTPSVLLSNSELRDICLAPSNILPAQVTIFHPQLRDLILPLHKGHVLYPSRSAIYEQRWNTPDDASSTSTSDVNQEDRKPRQSSVKELFKLTFIPTCMTTNGSIFACGGQKAELYMCDLPQEGPLRRSPVVKPFELNMHLPSGWINNAICILPSWPNGWAQRQAECQRAHAGYDRHRDGQCEDCDNSDDQSDTDMDLIDEEDDDSENEIVDYDEVQSPAVATYPNTMPFGHAPRIPVRGGRSRGPQYVTSRRASVHSTCSGASHRHTRVEMPRILVSNNDKTVKMFCLRPNSELSQHTSEWTSPSARAPATSALRHTQASEMDGNRLMGSGERVPPPRPLFGSAFGYEGIGLNEGILTQNSITDAISNPISFNMATTAELSLRRTRYLGESQTAYRDRNPIGEGEEQAGIQRNMQFRQARAAEFERRERLTSAGSEPRKLSLIGGTRFKVPVNHASLSPDLRTMVTVGDSNDVYLYEVIDGGRQFRKIGVYSAATDWCFSTAWSKDGRRFAVASQDGQVTVWDHRSSRPLALFYSRPSKESPHIDTHNTPSHLQQDEVSSSSGREAARVVKFSPEGSSRDLLVFSEENTNIHIIDARTFDTHVVIPVPHTLPGEAAPTRRTGVDCSHTGISGIGFDPSGDWLYAGTERTVVEWDLRRHGGGEGGTWSMA